MLGIFDPLRKLMKTPVGRLSGGERRMVSIGRGLMTDAKLYLADEPSLGLAPKIGMAVMEALLAIDLKDSAMFIAEQNVALLEGRVDRIIGMHAGKLKGEASSSFRLSGQSLSGRGMDIAFLLINAIMVAAYTASSQLPSRSPGRASG